MQVDVEFRGILSKYEDQGARSFTKHKQSFVDREVQVQQHFQELDGGSLKPGSFLKKVSQLYIHPKYFKILEAAAQRIEAEGDDPEKPDEYLDEFTEGILVGPQSGRRARTLSKMYFGEMWVNSF